MKMLLYFLFCAITARIGFTITQSLYWGILSLFFAHFSWTYWIVTW